MYEFPKWWIKWIYDQKFQNYKIQTYFISFHDCVNGLLYLPLGWCEYKHSPVLKSRSEGPPGQFIGTHRCPVKAEKKYYCSLWVTWLGRITHITIFIVHLSCAIPFQKHKLFRFPLNCRNNPRYYFPVPLHRFHFHFHFHLYPFPYSQLLLWGQQS